MEDKSFIRILLGGCVAFLLVTLAFCIHIYMLSRTQAYNSTNQKGYQNQFTNIPAIVQKS